MRPVAILDVGLNNNQVGRQGESTTTSEATDNTILMVTNRTGNIVLYCDQEIPDNNAWDHSNWKCQRASQDYYKWKIEGEENNSLNESAIKGTTSESDYYWKNSGTPDENEFNNNEAVIEDSVLGDSVNQLDVCKNEEKIFYEKPKLNFQTVTLLYDEVLPSTVKCMNYVNSIKDSEDLEYLLESEDESPEINENIIKKIVIPEGREKKVVKPEIIEDSSIPWENLDGSELEGEVEVVELTKSVKEVIQFPEIEEISETGKFTDESSITEETSLSTIDHIDLIREARELSCEQGPNFEETKRLVPCPDNLKIIIDGETLGNSDNDHSGDGQTTNYPKIIEEIDLLSSIGRDIGVDLEKYVQPVPDVVVAMETVKQGPRNLPNLLKESNIRPDTNKLVNHEMADLSADTRKKEKMARNQARRRQSSHSTSGQAKRPEKRRTDHIVDNGPGSFDVYNIETAMPKIDLDVIESHLRAAREEERRVNERSDETLEVTNDANYEYFEKEDLLVRFDRLLEGEPADTRQRRNDREEIRRRLAMGPDAEDLRAERGRKPSLQSRLQSGMNLQICFMNETPSDTESPSSENDGSPGPLSSYSKQQNGHRMASRPQVLSLPPLRVETGSLANANAPPPVDEADFFARQARLQTEARMALAQAKEMAHMQMEVERQRLKQSPITEMVRSSLEKVGVQLGEDRRRLSRVLLTELNVAQLQVVANDLHARIAMLNEALVEGLLRRDDLHMEQDSMLVDVEDLTRYLGAKQESMKKRSREIQQHRQPGKVENLPGKWERMPGKLEKLKNRQDRYEKSQHRHEKSQKHQLFVNLEKRSSEKLENQRELEKNSGTSSGNNNNNNNNNETPKSLAREIMINCLMMRKGCEFSSKNARKERVE